MLTTQFQSISSKGIDVFYDTVFHVQKLDGHDVLSIYKLDFDFSTEELNTKNIPFTVDFGDSGTSAPNTATLNCFVDNLLLDNEKAVLVCGLSSVQLNLSQTINGDIHVGNAYCPVIYRYDINDHLLQKVYPMNDDIIQWSTMLQGNLIDIQPPLTSFDPENNALGFIFKTIRTVASSYNLRSYIDLDFTYLSRSLSLTNARIITSAASDGDYTSPLVFQKYVKTGDDKLLIGEADISGTKKILMFQLN